MTERFEITKNSELVSEMNIDHAVFDIASAGHIIATTHLDTPLLVNAGDVVSTTHTFSKDGNPCVDITLQRAQKE